MFQQTTIIGRLGADPIMKFTPSGQEVTNFSVATSRRYQGEEETTWFSVSVFGRSAENANQILHKGDLVTVVGRINPDPETGSPKIWYTNEGEARASYNLIGLQWTLLSAHDRGPASPGTQQPF